MKGTVSSGTLQNKDDHKAVARNKFVCKVDTLRNGSDVEVVECDDTIEVYYRARYIEGVWLLVPVHKKRSKLSCHMHMPQKQSARMDSTDLRSKNYAHVEEKKIGLTRMASGSTFMSLAAQKSTTNLFTRRAITIAAL